MNNLIKLAMVLLAVVAVYFVYSFTAMVAPFPVAVAAAGSLVGTYVGLAYAEIPPSQRRRAMYIGVAAMAIEATYGVLYMLSVQRPELFEDPNLIGDIVLAILHGAPFTLLLFFVMLFVVHSQQEEAQQADPMVEVLGEFTRAMQAMSEQQRYALPVPNLDEKLPFQCKTCGERFATANQVQAHYKASPGCKPRSNSTNGTVESVADTVEYTAAN